MLEDQYDATVAMLDATYTGRVTGFLYDSGDDAGLPSDHAGAAFPATSAFEATCVPPLDGNLMSLVSHEANHVIERHALGSPGTSMLNEGLASAVISERFHPYGRHFYYRWTRDHRSQVPSIARLADDGQWSKVQQDVAYNASASFLAYLLETEGAARLRQLYGVESGVFERDFQSIYGRTLAAAEADWLAFCNRQ